MLTIQKLPLLIVLLAPVTMGQTTSPGKKDCVYTFHVPQSQTTGAGADNCPQQECSKVREELQLVQRQVTYMGEERTMFQKQMAILVEEFQRRLLHLEENGQSGTIQGNIPPYLYKYKLSD